MFSQLKKVKKQSRQTFFREVKKEYAASLSASKRITRLPTIAVQPLPSTVPDKIHADDLEVPDDDDFEIPSLQDLTEANELIGIYRMKSPLYRYSFLKS